MDTQRLTPSIITHRRRANIMLFVVFILGALFASTLAFLALMRTDNEILQAAVDERHLDRVIDTLVDRTLVGSAVALKGQGAVLATDGDPCDGSGDRFVPPTPYLQAPLDCVNNFVPGAGADGLADNPDTLAHYATPPGADPALSSLEPYMAGLGIPREEDLEYFAAADVHRWWDGRSDVRRVLPPLPDAAYPAGRPLRIRRLDPDAGGPVYAFDRTSDIITNHGSLADADGDGVVDSRYYRIALLDEGEADFFQANPPSGTPGPDGYSPLYTDDFNCDGVIDTVAPLDYKGAPSFTGGLPTPLPCDDANGSGFLDIGTAVSQDLRRPIAAEYRDPDTADPDYDLYWAFRMVPNGARVNLNWSHRTLVDNLLGTDASELPVAARLKNLPYGAPTERLLRRRGMLPPRDLTEPLTGLGRDLFTDTLGGQDLDNSPLYQRLFGPMIPSGDTTPRWVPITDEPGNDAAQNYFDVDWVRWTDPGDNLVSGISDGREDSHVPSGYAMHTLLTTRSVDDLVLRNGLYVQSGGNTILLTDLAPGYSLNPLIFDPGQIVEGTTGGGFAPLDYQNAFPLLDSLIEFYPGYDPSARYDQVSGAMIGDRSFIDTAGLSPTYQPKVPVALRVGSGFNPPYSPRDGRGRLLDNRLGRMQFGLTSFGDINRNYTQLDRGITQREIDTVQAYFVAMLRNVTTAESLDPLLEISGDLDAAIHDQAAQLTANLIDFADYDAGIPGGGAGNYSGSVSGDLPTRVTSRRPNGPTFYGIEKQPYISQVYWDPGDPLMAGDPGEVLAIELTNPHPVSLDLSPAHAGGTLTPYTLRYVPDPGNPASAVVLFAGGSFSTSNGILAANDDTGANDHIIFFTSNTGYPNLPVANRGNDVIDNLPVTLPQLNETGSIQLLRQLPADGAQPPVRVICDEFRLSYGEMPPLDLATEVVSLERDNVSRGGWRVTVPQAAVFRGMEAVPTGLGQPNDGAADPVTGIDGGGDPIAPVHAMTSDYGADASFPTTGTMLLVMRYANMDVLADKGRPMTARLKPVTASLQQEQLRALDNGHMPVFDQTRLAQAVDPTSGVEGVQPQDGRTLLSIPWGQLVFDYFTALPFENEFDPQLDPPAFVAPRTPDDPDFASFVTYLRRNQPKVEMGGLRVHGRIDINSAPWRVLQGLPLMTARILPIYREGTLFFPDGVGIFPSDPGWNTLLPEPDRAAGDPAPAQPFPMGIRSLTRTEGGTVVEMLGERKAKGIVAYRELREISDNPAGDPVQWSSGNYNVLKFSGGVRGTRLRWSILDPDGDNVIEQTDQRHTAGFLTVGELANVRNATVRDIDLLPGRYEMDNGQHYGYEVPGNPTRQPYAQPDYLRAIAPLVAVSDWTTVKNHVFTAYGILTGHGRVSEIGGVRVEMVFDRSNLLLTDDPQQRPEIVYQVREPRDSLTP